MEKQRPAGITILATLFIILGLLSLFWGMLVFGVGAATGLTGAIFGAENMRSFGSTNFWGGIVSVAGGVLDLIVAFGLMALKKWAWALALIGVAVNVITGVLGLLNGGFFALFCGLLGLVIPGIILYYLMRPDVRAAFGR